MSPEKKFSNVIRHPEFISGSIDFIRSLYPRVRVLSGLNMDTDPAKAGRHDGNYLFKPDSKSNSQNQILYT